MEKRFLLFLAGLFVSIGIFAQVKVTGVVISADDNEPLIGASVNVKGAKTGVSTDIDGKFSITVPSTKSQLVVTYVGMKSVTVPVSKTPMTIALESSSTALDEVVVTGMTKMDKRLFTGAATKVDASEARIGGMADISLPAFRCRTYLVLSVLPPKSASAVPHLSMVRLSPSGLSTVLSWRT